MRLLNPTNELDAKVIQTLQDRLLGYPSTQHAHQGAGPHYTPPDGIYTRTHANPRKHPTLDSWTIQLPPLEVIQDLIESSNLTAQQKQRLQDALANAIESLPSDWFESTV